MIHHFKKYLFAQTQGTTQVVDFNNIRRTAFTLAEVLITLGIIGVVAAMTMPSLIANYKNKVLVNQAKSSYSKLSNALIMAKSQNGFDSYGELFGPAYTNDQIVEILSKDLKMVKICKQNQGGCFNWETKYQKKQYKDGKAIYYDFRRSSSVILSDGSVIRIYKFNHNGDCKWTNTYNQTDDKGNPVKDENGNIIVVNSPSTRCGEITFDVNGAKGPNQMGADTWNIAVYQQYLGEINNSLYFLYNDKLEYENYQEGED